jgi:hypothetical protein
VSGNDVRSVHELHHFNVLQLSVRRHNCEFDHAVRGSRVRRRYLRVSGSIQPGSTRLGPIPPPIYLSRLAKGRGTAN